MRKSRFSRTHFERWRRAIGALAGVVFALAASPIAVAQCDIQRTGPLSPTGASCGMGGCRYGYSVAISGDGNTAVIGAYGDTMSLGAVYIYVRSGGAWFQQGPKLVPNLTGGAAQFFGFSVAISADGNTVLVGAYGDAGYLGAAHVFVRSGTTWSQQGGKLVPVGGVGVQQYFGSSVALTADGNGALVGAYGDNVYRGAAYWFTRSGTTWTLQGSRILPADGAGAPLYFGVSAALSANGSTAAIGSYADNNFIGAVHVFTRSGNTWTQQGPKLAPGDNAGAGRFGGALSLSADGNVLLAGARSDDGFGGSAHVFRRSSGTWSQRGAKLASPAAGGEFGSSVSLCSDGSRGMVGAPAASTLAGAAFSVGPRCPADYDCDGAQTTTDLFAFLNDWLSNAPKGDYNNVGGRTPQDIFEYLIAWFAPCS